MASTAPAFYESKDLINRVITVNEAKTLPLAPYRPRDPHIAHKSNYQHEYVKRDGKPALPLKTDDHINPGPLKLRDTTYRVEYRKGNDPRVLAGFQTDKFLEKTIELDGKGGHQKHLDHFHPDLGAHPSAPDFMEKPASYVKPRFFDRKFKMKGESIYHSSYRGHSQPVKLQKDPFNNLTTYPDMNVSKVTNYREKHTSKSPQRLLDSALHETNKEFDRNTMAFYKRPEVEKKTIYDKDYNTHAKLRNGGPDNVLNKALHSYYNSYYFENPV